MYKKKKVQEHKEILVAKLTESLKDLRRRVKDSELTWASSWELFWPVKTPLILLIHEFCSCAVENIERYCNGTMWDPRCQKQEEENRNSEFFLHNVFPMIRECILGLLHAKEMKLTRCFACPTNQPRASTNHTWPHRRNFLSNQHYWMYIIL